MKRHYKIIEFAIVFLFLVLPPVFAINIENTEFIFKLTPFLLCQAVIAFLLDMQTKETEIKKDSFHLINILSEGAITLGSLFLIYALLQALFYFVPSLAQKSSGKIVSPSNAAEYIVCIITVIISAYYEEILYRQYLPFVIYDFIKTEKKPVLIFEIFPVAFFSAAHLYLGLPGVLNALLSGFVLRRCRIKTNSVYTGTVVHIIYNLVMCLIVAK